MDKFWADMILEGKATYNDIRSEYRKKGVKKVLDQYLAEGKIEQYEYDMVFGIEDLEGEEQ